MPQSRKSQVSLSATHYYHCISRCVRRAFLCGEDKVTGKSYEHRRQWVEDKLLFLSQVFAIDICAYSVMSNHVHTVLFIDENEAESWSTEQVLSRWHQIFKGTLLTQSYLEGTLLDDYELLSVEETADVYRARLCSLSWFMRVLNESIAREANKEDGCTGRFWEGRFKSQALLDESALIACMAYVDLNPLRAGISNNPETSKYTSLRRRIEEEKKLSQSSALMPFIGDDVCEISKGLKFSFKDYIKLVVDSGLYTKENHKHALSSQHQPLLEQINITFENWLTVSNCFTALFHGPVGTEATLIAFHENKRHKRRSNLTVCRRLFA